VGVAYNSTWIYPGGRQRAGFAVRGKLFYRFGGSGFGNLTVNSDNGIMSDLWSFNTETDIWEWLSGSVFKYELRSYSGGRREFNETNFPGNREGHILWVFGDLIAVHGGQGRAQVLPSVVHGYFSDLFYWNVTEKKWGFW